MDRLKAEVGMKPEPRLASNTRKKAITDDEGYMNKRKKISANEKLLKK